MGPQASFRAKNSNGTSYFTYTDSAYFDISFTVNPKTHQYTSIKIGGIEQLGLGANPSTAYINSTVETPGCYFRLYSLTSTTGTVDIDDLKVFSAP